MHQAAWPHNFIILCRSPVQPPGPLIDDLPYREQGRKYLLALQMKFAIYLGHFLRSSGTSGLPENLYRGLVATRKHTSIGANGARPFLMNTPIPVPRIR